MSRFEITSWIAAFVLASVGFSAQAGQPKKKVELSPKRVQLLKQIRKDGLRVYAKCNSPTTEDADRCWVKYYAEVQECATCSASRGLQQTNSLGECIQELSCGCTGCVSIGSGSSGSAEVQSSHR